jgi:hypothetical protein
MRIITLAAVAALIASPAIAGEKKKKDPSKKMVCEEVITVGSHIPDRVCMTQAEWDQQRADVQNSYRGVVNRANSSTGGLIPGQADVTPGSPH